MNSERQKTDAIADAVEIPEGATHIFNGEPYKLESGNLYWWNDMNCKWVKDHFNRDVSKMSNFFVFGAC